MLKCLPVQKFLTVSKTTEFFCVFCVMSVTEHIASAGAMLKYFSLIFFTYMCTFTCLLLQSCVFMRISQELVEI